MKKIWTRNEAINLLTNVNGKFNAGTCNNTDEWYFNRDLLDLRDLVMHQTSFLDLYSSIEYKLRMLYFKLDLNSAKICKFCINLCLPIYGKSSFRQTCCEKACLKLQKSFNSEKMHKGFSEEKKKLIAKKIGFANSGTFDEKFGIQKSNILKKKISDNSKKRIQTLEEKAKRVASRRCNNKEWHSEKTKCLISLKNQITHSSTDYKEKHAESRIKSRQKQSETMKRKIESGNFTPNSNNWRRSVSFKLNIDEEEHTFRSKWEAIFYLMNLENSNKLLFEFIRIPYCYENKEHIYIVDFVDINKNKIFEVRPKCRQNLPKEKEKFLSAMSWATKNNFEFILIDEDWFSENKLLIEEMLKQRQEIKERLKFKCPT